MALIWKGGYFWPTFYIFLFTREKLQKFLQHISHSHTYMYFAHPIDFLFIYFLFIYLYFYLFYLFIYLFIFALPILKKNTNLSGMVSLWCDFWCWFFFAPFWNKQQITKWWPKFKLECLLLICIYTNAKFIVICKPRTLNDGGEDSVKYRNRKKHCFLAAAILLFIGKIIITW